MKKAILIFFFGLLWCNIGVAKIIKLNQEIYLDVPETHNFISFEEDSSTESLLYGVGELFENLDELGLNIFLAGSTKIIDIFQSVADGTEVKDLEIFQPLLKKAEKKEYYDVYDQKVIKWLGKELKKIAKKEKIDFYTYVFFANKKIDEIDDLEIREFFNLHKNMNKSDLAKATKEYKKYLTQWAGDNKTFLLNENVSLILKKFKISKNNNQVFLRSDFTMSYLHAMNVPMNLIISIKNDHIFLIISECWVNCSKQSSKFEKMIKPLFTASSINTSSISSGESNLKGSTLAEEIKKLNELYKSGVLTKEEFEKAKKKILN